MTWLVIRVRSDRTVERSIRETMESLNLTRVNHAVLIPESETYAGMLQKVKDFVPMRIVCRWANVGAVSGRRYSPSRALLMTMGSPPVTSKSVTSVWL